MEKDNEYWEKVFSGTNAPEKVRKAIKRVYGVYPNMPQGICDPMYIMNCIAYELGIGDGNGNFDIKD